MDYVPAGAAIGGRLIVADVGRDTLTVQVLCELGGGEAAVTSERATLPAQPLPHQASVGQRIVFGGRR